MSGDVQPRKRKDKKRRKDEPEQEAIRTTILLTTPTHIFNDDQNIHVHKESGTGGGICAKLVFFILFSALTVLIGLIITEHRGLTDVDVVDTNSKFAEIFRGWTDSEPARHEHNKEELLSHEDEDDEDEDHDEDVGGDSEEEEPEDEEEEHEEETETQEDEEDELTEEISQEAVQDEDDEEDEGISKEAGLREDTEEERDEEDESRQSDEEQADEDQDDDEDQENNVYEVSSKEDEKDISDIDDEEIEKEKSEEENLIEEDDNSKNQQDNNEDIGYDKSKEVEQDNDDDKSKPDEGDDDDDYYDEQNKPLKKRSTEKDQVEQGGDDDDGQKDKNAEVSSEKDEHQESEKDPNDEAQGNAGSEKVRSSQETRKESGNKTNDFTIIGNIEEAEKYVGNNPPYAVKLFDKILEKFPSSFRSLYEKALALDNLADQKRSNDILYEAIDLYIKLLTTKDIPDSLAETIAEQCIKRMRFAGEYSRLINVHRIIIERFFNNPKHYNDLAITYLILNRIEKARLILEETLEKWPQNGVALVHYGFILKTADNNLEKSVEYLKKGLESKEAGVIDGRFYFHLGDALTRLGRTEAAMRVYKEGTKNKVFLSKYQRSLYNVNRLTGKPFWEPVDLPYQDLFRYLKQYWKQIRGEGLSVLNEKGFFQDESENLKDKGDWKQFELYARGLKNVKNCGKTPFTCSMIDKIPEAKGCKRGQTKFSVIHPGTHVWPHCGPTNCRLRIHLGLKVPPNTFLRVAEETRSWKNGEILAFDDSFEHEVWHNGTDLRLILIVDVWHPELTAMEKRNLSPI